MKNLLAPLLGATMLLAGSQAMAQSDTTKDTGVATSVESYFKDNREPMDPAMTATYQMGAEVPATVRMYEFRGRPELAKYRYTMSGGSIYVVGEDRRVMRILKPENK